MDSAKSIARGNLKIFVAPMVVPTVIRKTVSMYFWQFCSFVKWDISLYVSYTIIKCWIYEKKKYFCHLWQFFHVTRNACCCSRQCYISFWKLWLMIQACIVPFCGNTRWMWSVSFFLRNGVPSMEGLWQTLFLRISKRNVSSCFSEIMVSFHSKPLLHLDLFVWSPTT